tara:strand:- start:2204 stop:2533 length:330 start_codon:yes stop_codon:yes gene_type:complete
MVLLFGLLTLGMSNNANAQVDPSPCDGDCHVHYPLLKAGGFVVKRTGKVVKGVVIVTGRVVKGVAIETGKVLKGTYLTLRKARGRVHNFVFHPPCRTYVLRRYQCPDCQ